MPALRQRHKADLCPRYAKDIMYQVRADLYQAQAVRLRAFAGGYMPALRQRHNVPNAGGLCPGKAARLRAFACGFMPAIR